MHQKHTKTDEKKIYECYEAIQAALPYHRFTPKKTLHYLRAVFVGNDYNSWDAATGILDDHGYERRGNRPVINDIIQKFTS